MTDREVKNTTGNLEPERSGPIVAGSIRGRLFLQLAAIAALLSLALFLVVRAVAENSAETTQDDILAASAIAIADSLRVEEGKVTLDLPYSALSMLGTINQDRVFYRVVVNKQTLTGYEDLPLPARLPGLSERSFATFNFRGDEVRSVSVVRPVGSQTRPVDVWVTVAQTRLGMEALSTRLTVIATAIGVGFFVVATALSLLAARSALRQLSRVTRSVTRRGPNDLRPIIARTPAELLPIVHALNSFMSRLRISLTRSEEFIAEAAHRVRTPLATVRAQAEVTHHRLKSPEHRQAIREMIRAVDESSRSAGQILDHAMVIFRTDALANDELDLCEIARETCDRLSPTADLKDIDIVQAIPDGPMLFPGDGILLQSALHNILDNAIKYSPEDSEITVALDNGTDYRLYISDQGRGFSRTDIPNLTKRFMRGSNVNDIVGSGLGLTIADEVARAHGGRIELSQQKTGSGACVVLILPRP